MKGFPRASGTAEGFFQARHPESRSCAESTETADRASQRLDESLFDLRKVSIRHENVVLDLRCQLIRRLAAYSRHLVVGNVLPLLLFSK